MIIQTTTGAEPTAESPEYIQAMIDKADGISQTPPVAPPAGDSPLLAGKYKTVEDLEKGYRELQKSFSSRPKVEPIAADPEKPVDPLKIADPTPEELDSADAAANTLESKGLDITVFNQEWQETGALSPESYEKLQNSGIPKEMVDAYIEGQQVIAERLTTRVFDTAGGKEEYVALMDWAKTGVSAEERNTYNTITESGDINSILLAVKGLKATMEEVKGRSPQLLTADGMGNAGNSDTYTSKSQVTAAMGDPRYSKDSSYRNEVIAKLSRSSVF